MVSMENTQGIYGLPNEELSCFLDPSYLGLVDSGLSQSSVFGALCLNGQAHTHRYTFVHSAMSQQPFSAD